MRQIELPYEVQKLGVLCKREMMASEVWLFGSRARGDHTPDSDFDLLAVVPDDAPEDIDSPLAAFRLRRRSGAHADLLTARQGDFDAARIEPTLFAHTIVTEGVRLDDRPLPLRWISSWGASSFAAKGLYTDCIWLDARTHAYPCRLASHLV